ncbi:MAG TPA: hypothetical protein VFI87_15815 [Hyphomicrobiaceae bacterium]|nr:hypothetical protein [Hyphomicrobiaceae bacterium]
MPSDRRGAANGDPAVARAPTKARGEAPWPVAMFAAIALGVLVAGGASDGAEAQQSADGPRIVVATTILAEPASQTVLSIQVGPPGSVPGNTFVRLRGLPASVSLSEGYAIAPGSWAVPLFGLPSLKAIVPAGVSGRSEIIIHLVGVDGTTLAETKTALVVGPATIIAPPERPAAERIPAERPQQRALATSPAPTPPAAPNRNVQPPAPANLTADEKQRAERLVISGDRHLEQGNIGAARQFFQRAAEAGLALGAIKMAATYDPSELDRLGVKVQGAIPDRAEARKWYERARTLGAPEAEDRLARIGGS